MSLVDAAAFQASYNAAPAQMADIETFVRRLTETNAVMNLVGPDSLPDVWNRHIWDSAQLIEMKPDANTWARCAMRRRRHGRPRSVSAIIRTAPSACSPRPRRASLNGVRPPMRLACG